MSYIALDLNGLALTFDRCFIEQDYPRRPNEISVDSSANNTIINYGNGNGEPELFEFAVLISPTQRDQLDVIYRKHRRLLETLQTNFPIILTDTTQLFKEEGSRTRAIAPAPYNTVQSNYPYSGWVAYYAKFYVVFTAPPTFSQEGRRIKAGLSLKETGAKVTP